MISRRARLSLLFMVATPTVCALVVPSWGQEKSSINPELEQAIIGGAWQDVLNLQQPVVVAFLREQAYHRLREYQGAWRAAAPLQMASTTDLQPCVDWAQAFVDRHRDQAVAWELLSAALWCVKEDDKAIAAADEAIRLRPDGAVAYTLRGNAIRSKHELDKKIADYTKSIELDPRYVPAYLNRGDAYTALQWVKQRPSREWDRAIADYTTAIELDPSYAKAHIRRGNRSGPPGGNAYLCRGGAYHDEGEWDKAIADYTKAIELDPRDSVAYALRGDTYRDKGDPDKAIVDYTKAIDLYSRHVWTYYQRGLLYRDAGQKEEAIRDFRKYIEIRRELGQDEDIRFQVPQAQEELRKLGAEE